MNEPSPSRGTAADLRTLRLELTLSGWAELPATVTSECHVVGFALRVGDIIRQSCAWCGIRIATARTEQVDEPSAEFPAALHEDIWQVGGFIRSDVGGRGVVGILWQDPIPPDACFNPTKSK